jgi:hypothetical protein
VSADSIEPTSAFEGDTSNDAPASHASAGPSADRASADWIVVPAELRGQVKWIGNEIKPIDLGEYGRYVEIEDKSHKLRTILEAWKHQQEEERGLRQSFAKWLLGGLFIQMILVNAAFFCIGFGILTVDKWVASSFILAVLAEIAGMATIVIKYLFPNDKSDVLDLIQKL